MPLSKVNATRAYLLSTRKAVRAARQIASEFADFSSDFFRTALSLFRDAVRATYVMAQDSLLGNLFLDNGSLADRTLNKILGFGNQKERLEYLMRRTVSSNAAKMLEILTPAIEQNSPISPSAFRQFDQGTDMMIKAQLRITQLSLDEKLSRFIGVGLKPPQDRI